MEGEEQEVTNMRKGKYKPEEQTVTQEVNTEK